jgi:hypothetical protein
LGTGVNYIALIIFQRLVYLITGSRFFDNVYGDDVIVEDYLLEEVPARNPPKPAKTL